MKNIEEIVDFRDLFIEEDDPFLEALRLHDIENYELMGYDFSELLTRSKKPKMKKVEWIILPPGRHPFQKVIEYIRELEQTRWINKPLDANRLKAIYELGIECVEVIVGANKFEGYFIFSFPKLNTYVLDCPLYGNAIYVFKGSWRKVKHLSKLSKGEILRRYPDTKRLIHKGQWVKRLSNLLKVKK